MFGLELPPRSNSSDASVRGWQGEARKAADMLKNILSPTVAGLLSISSVGCIDTTPAPPPNRPAVVDVIDDMEDGDISIIETDGRGGQWEDSDDASGGEKMPPKVEPVTRKIAFAGDPPTSQGLHVSGSGFQQWGSVVKVALANGAPYDASRYDGLRFFAKGSGGFYVSLSSPQTEMGFSSSDCTICSDHFGEQSGGDNAPAQNASFWQEYRLPFASMTQQGWGDAKPALDTTQLVRIQFLFGSKAVYDLWVDDISFYAD